jgi:hypothetical protein
MNLPAQIVKSHLPSVVKVAGERAQTRFWEFFAANIRNKRTRRRAGDARNFLDGCERADVASIAE